MDIDRQIRNSLTRDGASTQAQLQGQWEGLYQDYTPCVGQGQTESIENRIKNNLN